MFRFKVGFRFTCTYAAPERDANTRDENVEITTGPRERRGATAKAGDGGGKILILDMI